MHIKMYFENLSYWIENFPNGTNVQTVGKCSWIKVSILCKSCIFPRQPPTYPHHLYICTVLLLKRNHSIFSYRKSYSHRQALIEFKILSNSLRKREKMMYRKAAKG